MNCFQVGPRQMTSTIVFKNVVADSNTKVQTENTKKADLLAGLFMLTCSK